MFVKLSPPSVLTCHCTAGNGLPPAEAVNAAELPTHTFGIPGFVVTAGAVLTVSVRTREVLPLKLASPLYCTVTECEPAASDEVENLACPDPSKVSASITVEPSLKSTVPVGVPRSDPLAATATENVTGCPRQETLGEAPAVVVAVGFWTVMGGLVSEDLLESEISLAVRVCVPNVRKLTLKLFVPETSAESVGNVALASLELKLTVSVTVPATFQKSSTALTTTLKATPAVCARGAPVLPGAVPGVDVSPGASNCNLVKALAPTLRLELGTPATVPSVAVSVVVSALVKSVVSAFVERPLEKPTEVETTTL